MKSLNSSAALLFTFFGTGSIGLGVALGILGSKYYEYYECMATNCLTANILPDVDMYFSDSILIATWFISFGCTFSGLGALLMIKGLSWLLNKWMK